MACATEAVFLPSSTHPVTLCSPEDAKSSLYLLRPPGYDVNAEVSLMISEANEHSDKDEVSTFLEL